MKKKRNEPKQMSYSPPTHLATLQCLAALQLLLAQRLQAAVELGPRGVGIQ
jgi:hypothetical protein